MNKKIILLVTLFILITSIVYAVKPTDSSSRAQELRECYKNCQETKLADIGECNQDYKDERSGCKSTYDLCKKEAKSAYEECKSSNTLSLCRLDYKEQIEQCNKAYKTCKKTSTDTKKACYSEVKDNYLSCKLECKEDITNTATTTATSSTTTISIDQSSLLKICPDSWLKDSTPCIGSCDHVTEYFLLDGQRRELNEFDLGWVFEHCELEKEISE